MNPIYRQPVLGTRPTNGGESLLLEHERVVVALDKYNELYSATVKWDTIKEKYELMEELLLALEAHKEGLGPDAVSC